MNKKMKKRKQAAAEALQDNSTLLVKDKENQANGKTEAEGGDISEQLDLFETWVIANGKKILIAAVLIIIGVSIFLTVQHFRTQAVKEDTAKLAAAEKVEQLEKVLKEISPTIPGYDAAQIRLARLYAADKKYDQAYAAYFAVAERKNDLFLSVRSRLDAAYIKELAGKPAEAAAVFAMVADSADVLADFRAEAAYGAGRLFLVQKNDAAARKYLSMTDPMKAATQTASQWGMLAQALLNRMPAAKAPAVKPAPTIQPPAKPAAKAPAAKPAPAKPAAKAPAAKPAPAKAPAAKPVPAGKK